MRALNKMCTYWKRITKTRWEQRYIFEFNAFEKVFTSNDDIGETFDIIFCIFNIEDFCYIQSEDESRIKWTIMNLNWNFKNVSCISVFNFSHEKWIFEWKTFWFSWKLAANAWRQSMKMFRIVIKVKSSTQNRIADET